MGLTSPDTTSSSQQQGQQVSLPPQQQSVKGVPAGFADMGDPNTDGRCRPNPSDPQQCASLQAARWAGLDIWHAMQAYGMTPVDPLYGLYNDVKPDHVPDAYAVGRNRAGTVFRFFYWSTSMSYSTHSWSAHVVASNTFTKANQVQTQVWNPVLNCYSKLVIITSNIDRSVLTPKPASGTYITMPQPQYTPNIDVYITFAAATADLNIQPPSVYTLAE